MVTTDIGINAENIWYLLCEKGKLSLKEIRELTKYNESIIYSALEWLSKEGKIEISTTDGSMYVELRKPSSEIYY